MDWVLPVLLGVVLVVAGAIALLSSGVAGVAAMVVLGALLVTSGAFEIVAAFEGARERGFWLTFLAGVLSVATGVMMIVSPLSSLAAVTLLVGGFFVAVGVLRAVTSIVERYAHWGWDFAYGVLSALLGAYVLAAWPASTVWVIGTLVGVELVFRGAAWLGAGMAMHRASERGGPRDRAGSRPSIGIGPRSLGPA
jgi:uncharacterized membrane protein HdeD (DUF308 family)